MGCEWRVSAVSTAALPPSLAVQWASSRQKITTLPVTRVVFGEQECVSPVTAPPSSAGPERQSPDYKGSDGGVALFKALESRNSRHSGQEERGAL